MIRRYDGRLTVDEHGTIYDRGVPKKTYLTSTGYLCIWYSGRNIRAHQIVYTTWWGPIPEGMEIDHIDGNPVNNSPDNLEAVTHSENVLRRCKRPRKRNCRKAVVLKKPGEPLMEFKSVRKAAEFLGVVHGTVSAVLNGQGKTVRGYEVREATT